MMVCCYHTDLPKSPLTYPKYLIKFFSLISFLFLNTIFSMIEGLWWLMPFSTIFQLYHSMSTGFFIWYMYYVPFYLHFWGYIQIFGGAMYPLTLYLGVQRKLTAFSPCKVVHHAVFCKYYAELAKTFFSVWHCSQEVGFCLTHGLCVCPTIFL